MRARVEGHNNLVKDTDTGVINNVSSGDRDKYRLAKRQAHQVTETEHSIQEIKEELSELSDLKEEVSELKDLLHKVLGKLG